MFGTNYRLEESSDHSSSKNAAGFSFIVNGARYRDMIIRLYKPKLQDMDVNDMWFQQDSTKYLAAREINRLTHKPFVGHVISRFGIRNGSPRPCDLTPLDSFEIECSCQQVCDHPCLEGGN